MYENGKVRPVETFLRMKGDKVSRMMKRENLRYTVSTFVNVTMYS
jgi:hypothetical protein